MRWKTPSAPGWSGQRAKGQNLDGTFPLAGDYNSAECDPEERAQEHRGKKSRC